MNDPSKNTNSVNFLEFVGFEETNFLVSLQNMRQEFDAFSHLDGLFQAAIQHAKVPPNRAIVMQLLLFVHYHLFFSTATLLRCHLSEAFASARSAVDAALTAYRIIEGHGTQEEYVEGAKTFRHTPNYIREARKKDPSLFPLAGHLLKVHGEFSRSASHADFAVFMHRLEIKSSEREMIQLGYFQFPKTSPEAKFYFLALLHTFTVMASVFEEFLVHEVKAVPQEWAQELRRFGISIENWRAKTRASGEDKSEPPQV
jgi:hypothetical protein